MRVHEIDSVDDVDPDIAHQEALEASGFWGKQGAGCVVLARETGRILIGLRSQKVLEPGTWGTWGGALDAGLSVEQGVLRELAQETGYAGEVELMPAFVFVSPDGGFRYANFVAVIDQEFEPTLNWENEGFLWVEPAAVPEPMHFGLRQLMTDPMSTALMVATDRGQSPV